MEGCLQDKKATAVETTFISLTDASYQFQTLSFKICLKKNWDKFDSESLKKTLLICDT